MSGDRLEVHEAYRRTGYLVRYAGEPVEIRIGENTPRLDAMLRALDVTRWAFVSASNPHVALLSDAENASRFTELVRVVEAEGFTHFPGEGVGDDGTWPAEQSLLVLDIDEPTAIAVARRFAQEAIVVGEAGAVARLVFCDGASK